MRTQPPKYFEGSKLNYDERMLVKDNIDKLACEGYSFEDILIFTSQDLIMKRQLEEPRSLTASCR